MVQSDDFHSIANLNAVRPKPAISRFPIRRSKTQFCYELGLIDSRTSGWNNVLVQLEMF
jgi:hypothetical protein